MTIIALLKMMLENDASSVIYSTGTVQFVQRRAKSEVWNLFMIVDGKAECNYCT
ncbi:448_t:CDS:1, partial [Entrophospora sp. SA101]